jgi:hypothetical protein
VVRPKRNQAKLIARCAPVVDSTQTDEEGEAAQFPALLPPLLRRKLLGVPLPTTYFPRPLFRRASGTEGQRHYQAFRACSDVRVPRLTGEYRHF